MPVLLNHWVAQCGQRIFPTNFFQILGKDLISWPNSLRLSSAFSRHKSYHSKRSTLWAGTLDDRSIPWPASWHTKITSPTGGEIRPLAWREPNGNTYEDECKFMKKMWLLQISKVIHFFTCLWVQVALLSSTVVWNHLWNQKYSKDKASWDLQLQRKNFGPDYGAINSCRDSMEVSK